MEETKKPQITISGDKSGITARQFEELMKVSGYLQQFEMDVTLSNLNVVEDVVITGDADLRVEK